MTLIPSLHLALLLIILSAEAKRKGQGRACAISRISIHDHGDVLRNCRVNSLDRNLWKPTLENDSTKNSMSG